MASASGDIPACWPGRVSPPDLIIRTMDLKPETRTLCQAVLGRRAPGLLPVLDSPMPAKADVIAVGTTLTEELAAAGFDGRYNPTDYGRRLEDAIDEVNGSLPPRG